VTHRLQPEALAALRRHVNEFVQRGAISGATFGVQCGDDRYVDCVGTASFDASRNVTVDTIFRISSMTKAVTAVATLAAIERGHFALDDPIDQWLPELANRRVIAHAGAEVHDTVPATRAITVRDLLTFTLGFGAAWDDTPLARAAQAVGVAVGPPHPQAAPNADEFLQKLGSLPLFAQPGTKWLYHSGSDVLGVLLERVHNKRLDHIFDEYVLHPLGMLDTSFWVPAEKRDRFTVAYGTDYVTGAITLMDHVDGEWAREPAFLSGGAGLVSTVSDYLAFCRMLLHDGAGLISSSAAVAMRTNQLPDEVREVSGLLPDDFCGRGWGFGVMVTLEDLSAWEPAGQFGWSGGLGSIFTVHPASGLSAVLLTNGGFRSPELPPVVATFVRDAYAARV
jgi:CubicO group peptidase (beta-lactamase class C family)